MHKTFTYLIIIFTTAPIYASWTQDTFNSLTLDQKIGQLFIVDAAPPQEADILKAELTYKGDINLLYRCKAEYVEKMIKEYHVGGLLFLFRSNATSLAEQINHYQQMAAIPLLITLDAEWGLTMRLDNTLRYPRAMTLGALRNPGLIYDVAHEIGKQCKVLGVHMNIAPVVDVNNNPENPVISDRSFGESKEEVARRATLFMQGLHDAGIVSCAKHFPGHGDTCVDSHRDLPIINHSVERLTDIELYPFKKLIAAGVPAIMTAHLHIPAFDATPNLPATLSKKIITDVLRNELGFKGLIITDGMVMAGITKHHQSGYADLQAIIAGNDLIIRPTDVPKAVTLIKQALADGTLSMQELDAHVMRILRAKEMANVHCWKPVDTAQAVATLATPHARSLKQQAFAGAVTVVKNSPQFSVMDSTSSHCQTAQHEQGFLNQSVMSKAERSQIHSGLQNKKLFPLKTHDAIAYLQIGNQKTTHLRDAFMCITDEVASFYMPANATIDQIQSTLSFLESHTKIVVGIFEMNKFATKNYGIFPSTLQLLKQLHTMSKEVVLVLFGSPYSLKMFEHERVIIMAYEDDDDTQKAVADILYGNIVATGMLPVTASDTFKARLGLGAENNLTLVAQ